MIGLRYDMQGEDIFESFFSVLMTSVMCLNLICKRKIYLSILMTSVEDNL
jgi:hypothetical protein